MIDGACVTICNHSKLKIEENGRSAVFLNEEDVKLTTVKVDGCLKIDGPRADYVVEKADTAVIVKLKGRDVEHGADQVLATAHMWMNDQVRCTKVAGIIVARQYPKASSSIQIKQQSFARRFKGPLHIVTKNMEYVFENVLSFKGPLKR